MNVKIDGRRKINLNVIVFFDKLIFYRSIMIGSLVKGVIEIENFFFLDDCLVIINCFKNFGIDIEI